MVKIETGNRIPNAGLLFLKNGNSFIAAMNWDMPNFSIVVLEMWA